MVDGQPYSRSFVGDHDAYWNLHTHNQYAQEALPAFRYRVLRLLASEHAEMLGVPKYRRHAQIAESPCQLRNAVEPCTHVRGYIVTKKCCACEPGWELQIV